MQQTGRRYLYLVFIGLLAVGGAVGGGCGYRVARLVLGTPPFTARHGHTNHLMLPMRDGVRLATDIHLPRGEGPWPTLLVRNPYNMADWFGRICDFFTRYGYACVHQDVRGRQRSEGVWDPLVHERADGLDTLAWLVQQPFQDGNIALFGMSYLGAVQWAVADALPPQVKTMLPLVVSTHMRDALYQSGMFRHEVFTLWAALMPTRTLNVFGGRAYQKAIRHYPPIEVDEKYFGTRLEWFRTWQMSPSAEDPIWQSREFRRLESMPERTRVPVLMIGAWYDLFTRGEIDDFARLASRDQSKLIIGPWCHLQVPRGDLPLPGDVGLGGQVNTILDWLGHHLRGEPLHEGTGYVQTYTLVEGAWRRWPRWPPETRDTTFYLGGGGTGPCDTGRLALEPVDRVARFTYDYDPRHPVPTRGGGPLLAFAIPGFGGVEPGSVLQPPICYRPDVVSFLSEPLEQDRHIAGPIRVLIHVASTAADTAFTAKICAVMPSGKTYNIRTGIASLAYREGDAHPVAYTPGVVVPLVIETWPIEWLLRAGTRLRVDISSSDFPAYHAHANRPGPWALQDDPIVARQSLFVGGDFPSRLELPVWEGAVPGRGYHGEALEEER